MHRREPNFRRAAKIGCGALLVLSSVTPALAASLNLGWLTEYVPSQNWAIYLLYGSFGLLVVSVLAKIFATSMSHKSAQEVRSSESAQGYSIGDHRNSVLNPFHQ